MRERKRERDRERERERERERSSATISREIRLMKNLGTSLKDERHPRPTRVYIYAYV